MTTIMKKFIAPMLSLFLGGIALISSEALGMRLKSNSSLVEKSDNEKNFLHTFNKDLLASILSYLPPRKVVQLRGISRKLNATIQNEEFLNAFCKKSVLETNLTYEILLGLKKEEAFSLKQAALLPTDTVQSIKNVKQLLEWAPYYKRPHAPLMQSLGDIFFEHPDLKIRFSDKALITVIHGRTPFSAFLNKLVDELPADKGPIYRNLVVSLNETQADDWFKAVEVFYTKKKKEEQKYFFSTWTKIQSIDLKTGPQPVAIKIFGLPELKELWISFNHSLTSLTVENLPDLHTLSIGYNSAMTQLTMKNLRNLKEFHVTYNSALAYLIVKNFSALQSFSVSSNSALDFLELENLPALLYFYAHRNELMRQLIVKNCVVLQRLNASDNPSLTQLIMKNLPALQKPYIKPQLLIHL